MKFLDCLFEKVNVHFLYIRLQLHKNCVIGILCCKKFQSARFLKFLIVRHFRSNFRKRVVITWTKLHLLGTHWLCERFVHSNVTCKRFWVSFFNSFYKTSISISVKPSRFSLLGATRIQTMLLGSNSSVHSSKFPSH